MKRILARIFGGLVALVLVALAAIYLLSNRIIYKRYTFVPHALTVSRDSISIAQGERIVRMRCIGCHGDSLQGNADFFDEPMIARIVAPNVPARLATLTDAEFAGFIRTGIRKDGTSPFVMPPPGFYHASDADLGALIAYVRSLPVDSTPLPRNSYGPMGRLGVVLGQFKTSVHAIDTTQERVGQDPAWATTRQGEYLARFICADCHGSRLTGDPMAVDGSAASPSLSMALGYSADEFTTLLRTGTPREPGKQLAFMGEAARSSLHLLTDGEIAALYDYLKALPPSGVAGR